MNGFFSLLATYYLCGATLALGPLPHDQELRCSAATAAVSAVFLTPEEFDVVTKLGLSQRPIMHAGLMRFDAWETENEELVAAFEQVARTIALTMR